MLTTILLGLLMSLTATISWAQNKASPENIHSLTPTLSSALTLEAQQLAKTHMKKLKKTLQGSIIASGPAASIKVCSVSAPAIARSLGTQHDWHIARTSTRVRNPNNRADAWELRVLQKFAIKIKKGAPVKGLEETAVVNLNGKSAFRYMKAIPVSNACLTCHGRKISGSVATAINDHYPSDQATGYRKGELRGAVTLYKYLN
jgi:hypothetical protein